MASTIFTKDSITLFLMGRTFVVPSSETERHAKVVALLKAKASDKTLFDVLDNTVRLTKHVSGVFSTDQYGNVYIQDRKVPTALATRILSCVNDGLPINPLIKLWLNILKNPDTRAQTDLYPYLEHNCHPITDDGCFIAYRSVHVDSKGNYWDHNSRTFNNNVGQIVKMDRKDCDSNPEVTCSRGLHAANMDYVKSFNSGSDRVVVNIKINPQDVVAIPVDYDNHKMRCCQFYVDSVNKELTDLTTTLYKYDDEDDSYEDDEEWFEGNSDSIQTITATLPVASELKKQVLPKRDRHGRFLKTTKQGRDRNGRFLPK